MYKHFVTKEPLEGSLKMKWFWVRVWDCGCAKIINLFDLRCRLRKCSKINAACKENLYIYKRIVFERKNIPELEHIELTNHTRPHDISQYVFNLLVVLQNTARVNIPLYYLD